MKKLVEQFEKEYEFLYDHDNVAGYDETLEYFNNHIECAWFKALVKAFVLEYGDFISSDREASAFVFACETLGLLKD